MKQHFLKIIYITLSILSTMEISAQVGINTTKPAGILHVDPLGNNVAKTVNTDDVMIDQKGLGIGISPQQRLHIKANSPGTGIRITDGKEGERRVLTSSFDGTASWQYAGTIPIETGVLSNLGATIPLNTTGFSDTGSGIILPPGRWFVQLTIKAQFSKALLVDKVWIRTQFTPTGDLEGPNGLGSTAYISGYGSYTLPVSITGSVIINNTTMYKKLYRLLVGGIEYAGSDKATAYLQNFANNQNQNTIVAFQLL